MLALLQELSTFDSDNVPRLIMGIEEPVLFQHPPQARYLAEVGRIIVLAKECMIQTVGHFKDYLKAGFHKKEKLNEDALTQEYIKQAQILIRKNDYPLNIEGQYRDVYNLSRGFSDFFFYLNEQNVELSSIYSVESKRLPSPDRRREKEYVIGEKNNG